MNFGILTDTREVLSQVFIEKMDPSLVYIGWLRSYGLILSETSINYARVSLSDPAAEKDVSRLDDDEWLVVCPVEEITPLDDEVMDELDAHMGGMGLAM
ncbi:MAG: hypothetical protein Q9191_003060 [Dirinaria sp. TL-2023a]